MLSERDTVNAPIAQRQLLRLSCRQESLLVPIELVREILEVGRLTPLPQTPPFVKGVMNLRGVVIPVVDLGARFGMGHCEVGRRSAIVVVEVQEDAGRTAWPMGLLVDAVYEVLDIDAQGIESVPSLGLAIPSQFVAGMVNVRDRYAALINLAAALAPQELSALIGQAAAPG